MLSNRILMTLAAIGLAVPILIIAMRQTGLLGSYAGADCNSVTTHLEQIDSTARLPLSPVLVLGERTARNWPAQFGQLNQQPVLVRAFRGLTPDLVNACFARLAAFYRPSNVLYFLETRDRHKLETELAEELRALHGNMRRFGIDGPLIIIGLLQTPARDNERIRRLNQAVAGLSGKVRGLAFIDPNPLITDAAGDPDPHRFWPDGDTLDQAAYGPLLYAISVHLERVPDVDDRV